MWTYNECHSLTYWWVDMPLKSIKIRFILNKWDVIEEFTDPNTLKPTYGKKKSKIQQHLLLFFDKSVDLRINRKSTRETRLLNKHFFFAVLGLVSDQLCRWHTNLTSISENYKQAHIFTGLLHVHSVVHDVTVLGLNSYNSSAATSL